MEDNQTPLKSLMSSNRLAIWALILLTFFVRLSVGPRVIDDAYITFRYAENLASGLGMVYNPGERVLGTTTPFFALILAVLRILLSIEPSVASHWVAALADAATAWILVRLGSMLLQSSWSGLAAGSLFALSPLAIGFSISGMETSLAVALLLGALLSYLERNKRGLPMLLALAFLTRPEASLLILLVLIGFVTARELRSAWQTALAIGALLTPWLSFALVYFGSPVPQSILAKSTHVYQWGWSETASIFLSHLGFLFLGYPLARAAGAAWPGTVPVIGAAAGWVFAAILAFAQSVIMIIGARALIRAHRDAWPLLAFPIVYGCAFLVSATQHILIFPWYVAPLTPFYFLFMIGGIAAVARAVRRPPLEGAIFTVLAITQITGWQLRAPEPARPLDMAVGREEEYRNLALQFKDEFGTGDLVAASEIGAFGYFSNAYILDTVGLVSPEALKYYPLPTDLYSGIYAIPPDLVRETQPAYVVTMEVFIENGLLKDPQFLEQYSEIYRKPSEAHGGTNLLVFARRLPDQ